MTLNLRPTFDGDKHGNTSVVANGSSIPDSTHVIEGLRYSHELVLQSNKRALPIHYTIASD